jgi:dienelactone hydrolase
MTVAQQIVAEAAAGTWTERVLRFGDESALMGILTVPAAPRPQAPAVILVTAGMVHRSGPNRMHVTLAHALAGLGLVALRFDLSGIGDSRNRADGLPAAESAVLETQAAMSVVAETTGARTFALAGLCSGAVTAFRTAVHDDRVTATVLLNPQAFHHDVEWNAQITNATEARRYLTRSVADRSRWKRALTGQIDYRRAVDVLYTRAVRASTAAPPRSPISDALARQFEMLAARGTRQLVVCCEGDSSIDYMSEILGRRPDEQVSSPAMAVHLFERTDHSFTLAAAQRRLSQLVCEWLTAGRAAEAP